MTGNVTRGSGHLEKLLATKRMQIADTLLPEKLRSGRILDIGCGSQPYFLLNTKFNEKYGADPFAPTEKIEGIEIRKTDVEENKLPFKDDFFEAVTMLAVFEHIERNKLVPILTEIRRVLKPEGRFVLTTPCTWTDKLLRIMTRFNLVSQEEMKEHTGGFTGKQLRNYLKEAGFSKIKTGHFEMGLNNWAYAEK